MHCTKDELFDSATERLRTLASSMLSTFPNVGRWEETDDVLNTVSLRLLNRLDDGNIVSEKQFLDVAAAHMRWTLIQLARKFAGPQSFAANHDSLDGHIPLSHIATEQTNDLASLESWTQIHEAVEELPPDLKEVTDYFWYHGLSVAEIATILQLSESAIRKRWRRARVAIFDLCGHEAPA